MNLTCVFLLQRVMVYVFIKVLAALFCEVREVLSYVIIVGLKLQFLDYVKLILLN